MNQCRQKALDIPGYGDEDAVMLLTMQGQYRVIEDVERCLPEGVIESCPFNLPTGGVITGLLKDTALCLFSQDVYQKQ